MKEVLDIVADPLLLPVMLPLLVGAVAYVQPRTARWVPRLLGLLGGVAALIAGIQLAMRDSGLAASWTWVSLTDSISLSLSLARTPLGMVVLIGAAGFAILIAIYSFASMAGEYWETRFYAYLCWALAGTCLVALAGDLLVLLVGWELVTLMLFLMINQGRRDAKAGGAKAYGLLGFADACLLMAIVILLGLEGGSANLSLSLSREPISVASIGPAGYLVYVLIMLAALAKAGAVPVHTWIPAIAQDAPTPVMAFLPASVDKLLGIYLLAVLVLRMFRPDPSMQVVMMVIGAVTILSAVLMAMMQHNLKRLLSFHAVSQVGYMVLGIGTGTTVGVVGGLFHMLNNAIYKSNLFLMSGTVGRAAGSDEIEEMGGLARCLPVTFVCGMVAAASISGVPPFNGFASKWMVYQGTLSISSRGLGTALLVVAVFGSGLTLASFVKVIYSAFLSAAPKPAAPQARENFFRVVPMIVLAAACLVLGLCPALATTDILGPGIPEGVTTGGALGTSEGAVTTIGGLWKPGIATGLILLGVVIGLGLMILMKVSKSIRVVRPFLAGEVPPEPDDRFRVPGTHFYETIARLPGIGPALRHGEAGAMDPYHWSARHACSLVELLRRQRSEVL